MSLRMVICSLLVIALVAFSFRVTAQQEPAAPGPNAAPRWEYRVLKGGVNQCSSEGWLAGALNTLGQEGWELVGIQQSPSSFPTDAQGQLLIAPAAVGPNSTTQPPTADSFAGTIAMKMNQVQPGGCLYVLKRQARNLPKPQ
jgi:hypothetical protein